jgi:hypothetical protein
MKTIEFNFPASSQPLLKPYRVIDIKHLDNGMQQFNVVVGYAQTRLFKAPSLDALFPKIEAHWASVERMPNGKKNGAMRKLFDGIVIYPRTGNVPLITMYNSLKFA